MKLQNIAVIPARGGSKRVPGKNIRPLLSKPLIAYTIEAAWHSGLFEQVVVSTDSSEIAETASKHGAEIPFIRDPSLADDVTPVSAATVDVLKRFDPDCSIFGAVCQLMANCPLRNSEDVVSSHQQFLSTGAESQLSVVRYGWQNPFWAMRHDERFHLDPLFKEYTTARSQDLPELYRPTGAIWWARADVLRREVTYHIPTRTGWEIPWECGVDIDTQNDWLMGEVLMSVIRRQSKNDKVS